MITLCKNMEADASQSHAGKKVNSHSTEFKLEAVRFAVECSSRELKHQTETPEVPGNR